MSKPTPKPKLLIGGEFRPSTALEPLSVCNPCTEELLWTAPRAGAAEVAEALHHARAALKTWSKVHGWERAKVLRGIARAMEARKGALASALSYEIGRPISQSEGEV
ncbi:MAG: aldehyde dehydrogenase family protein, partial [Hyphomicrobiales bacterium]